MSESVSLVGKVLLNVFRIGFLDERETISIWSIVLLITAKMFLKITRRFKLMEPYCT